MGVMEGRSEGRHARRVSHMRWKDGEEAGKEGGRRRRELCCYGWEAGDEKRRQQRSRRVGEGL